MSDLKAPSKLGDAELLDQVLHHQLNLFRLSASEVAATIKRLKAMEKRLIEELSVPLLTDRSKRTINEAIENSEEIIHEYYHGIQLKFDCAGLGETVAQITRQSLEIALGLDSANLPTQSFFNSINSNVLIQGSPLKDWWAKQTDDVTFKFAAQVRQGLINGETNQQIVARIVGKSGQAGIMDVAKRDAAALVQTSVQTVANDARLATFRKNSDVLIGIRNIETFDPKTCLQCIAYDGAEWDLEGNPINGTVLPFDMVPHHINCRGALVGISKNAILSNRKGTRASDQGQIDRKTTFDQFLKGKSQAYVDEMLGPGRADLWRRGRITLKDLVDGQGRPLTLAELRAKFGLPMRANSVGIDD